MQAHRQRKQSTRNSRQEFVWGAEAAKPAEKPTTEPVAEPTPAPAFTRPSAPASSRTRMSIGVAAAVILVGGTVGAIEATSGGTAGTVGSVAQSTPVAQIPTRGLAPSASPSTLEATASSAVTASAAPSTSSSPASAATTAKGADPVGVPASVPSSSSYQAASTTDTVQPESDPTTTAAQPPETVVTTAATTATTAATTNEPSGCSTQWATSTAYVRGDEVSYAGQLWSANQWNYNEVPGGAAGAWDSIGSC